eukprot:2453100-Rhodomonas_salina.1
MLKRSLQYQRAGRGRQGTCCACVKRYKTRWTIRTGVHKDWWLESVYVLAGVRGQRRGDGVGSDAAAPGREVVVRRKLRSLVERRTTRTRAEERRSQRSIGKRWEMIEL